MVCVFKNMYFKGLLFYIRVWLIKNVELASSVQPNDSVTYMYLFPFKIVSHLGYYRMLSRVPYAI